MVMWVWHWTEHLECEFRFVISSVQFGEHPLYPFFAACALPEIDVSLRLASEAYYNLIILNRLWTSQRKGIDRHTWLPVL